MTSVERRKKYGSDLEPRRMLQADVFIHLFFYSSFTGNQTVNSTVQVRDVGKCDVTHHL